MTCLSIPVIALIFGALLSLEGGSDHAQISQPALHVAQTPSRYRAKIRSIRARLARRAPNSKFHMVVEPPFVVIGDGGPKEVEERARSTVRWAVSRLKKAYFAREPKSVLEIWLFANKRSYRKHTRAIFGDTPDTPYGYYSPSEGALVMNIATGGGTLIHEIVHPFIEANFPNCPAWFNEGLGSLYEASTERDGHIVGRTNWRLPGLQKALRAGVVPSFRDLTATTEEQFYGEDPGTNYAQARYLLYYLQEHGLLHEFYRRFRRNRRRDPTGYKTLKRITGERDMGEFFQRWKAYTLKLRYR